VFLALQVTVARHQVVEIAYFVRGVMETGRSARHPDEKDAVMIGRLRTAVAA
jgi:hypothetical protein